MIGFVFMPYILIPYDHDDLLLEYIFLQNVLRFVAFYI